MVEMRIYLVAGFGREPWDERAVVNCLLFGKLAPHERELGPTDTICGRREW